MKTTIIILTTIIIGFFLIFLLVKQIPLCEEWEEGYFAQTKMGRNYFLSFDFEEATQMYDGLIIKGNQCVKTN